MCLVSSFQRLYSITMPCRQRGWSWTSNNSAVPGLMSLSRLTSLRCASLLHRDTRTRRKSRYYNRPVWNDVIQPELVPWDILTSIPFFSLHSAASTVAFLCAFLASNRMQLCCIFRTSLYKNLHALATEFDANY